MDFLTPKQKIDAYTYAILGILSDHEFVCIHLKDWLQNIGCLDILESRSALPFFPEFEAQRPGYAGYVWWGEGDITSRLAALERAIELVKNKSESLPPI